MTCFQIMCNITIKGVNTFIIVSLGDVKKKRGGGGGGESGDGRV